MNERMAVELRLAIGLVARQLRRRYALQNTDGPTFSALALLAHLQREGGASTTQLAASEGVTTQAISARLRVLEDRGLITRGTDPADARRTVVTGTQRAADLQLRSASRKPVMRCWSLCSPNSTRPTGSTRRRHSSAQATGGGISTGVADGER